MTHLLSLAVPAALPAEATFGRDGAMFESLLGFVAQMSLVLWSLVTVTVVIRFVGIRFYRRSARRALARIAAAGASVPNIVGSTIVPPGATGSAATHAAAAVVIPAIAVVPAITAGIDLLQPANVPLPDTVSNVFAANSADR
ncbi:hypothetical protein ACTAQI_11020 [Pseudarthrobacter sp. alpha12b]